MDVHQNPLDKLSDEELDEHIRVIEDLIKRSKGDGRMLAELFSFPMADVPSGNDN